jgi:hypothetical protein
VQPPGELTGVRQVATFPAKLHPIIIGLNRPAISTVVERSSRYTLLVHLPRLKG